jgi:hypothetical protein
MRDVSGFNQKTSQCDGEELIRDGLKRLSKSYSQKLIEIIRRMLLFNEEERPTFEQLGRFIAGDDYVPRVDRSIIQQMEDAIKKKINNIVDDDKSKNNTQSKNIKVDNSEEEKKKKFIKYITKNKLKYNMNKQTFWFEYGGHLIAKYNIKCQNEIDNNSQNKNENVNKWKLTNKYMETFPMHFIVIYIDETYGYFLIGGTDGENTFQLKDGIITTKSQMSIQRSFMACVNINHLIFAIGGYDYSEKNQTGNIEIYEIEKNIWKKNIIKDLVIPRSQSSALVMNHHTIFVFGGYSKSLGTLNSIEQINLSTKNCELLDFNLPLPIRRFQLIKLNDNSILLLGGISKLSKKSEDSYIIDLERGKVNKGKELPQGGVLEHEVLFDEYGNLHLFFENNYGTSPPEHVSINFLDYIKE